MNAVITIMSTRYLSMGNCRSQCGSSSDSTSCDIGDFWLNSCIGIIAEAVITLCSLTANCCDPLFMMTTYPALFGGHITGSPPELPMNFRSKIIASNDGMVGIMLLWQQLFRKSTSTIKGYQVIMETKDGLDIRRSRCYVLQINNESGVIVDSRSEIFYLIIDDIQPMSSYTFSLYNLPRNTPFLQLHGVLQTNVNMSGYEGKFEEMSGNWDQYINCVYIKENNSLQILIELPPPTFRLTLFEINIFKDGLNGITDRSINSSLFNVHHDQSHIFNNGYIIWNYSIQQQIKFADVWVTPIDNSFPAECFCFLRNRQCVACRTTTTTCPVDNGDTYALPQNETEENQTVGINGKTDLVEWICVGGLVVCASLCAFIVFKRRYWSCIDKPKCIHRQEENINNERLNLPEVTPSEHSVNISDRDEHSIGTNEEAFPLVDSYNHQSDSQSDHYIADIYFCFISPTNSSDIISKSVSEQMLEINREFLYPNSPVFNENIDQSNFLFETKSLGGESV